MARVKYLFRKLFGKPKYVTYGKPSYDENGWVFLSVEKELVNYYCWAIRNLGVNIEPTRWPHITVVAGKYEQLPSYDIKLPKRVKIRYDGVIHEEGFYFWLVADCGWIHKFRRKNGLKPNLKFDPHITIGKRSISYGQERVRRPRS